MSDFAGLERASIIIPCYLLPDKDSELLRFTANCLASIRQFTAGEYELVLIDNGSPVGGDYLREQADIYVRNRQNLGYGPAVNQGLKLATAEWLVVCNNDIELVDDWVGRAVGYWQQSGAPFGAISSHLLDANPARQAGYQVATVGLMFGALWLTHRAVVDSVGLLDEGYRLGMFEDKDYWQRLKQAGLELGKIGHCRHIGNATWGKLPDQHETYVANMERYRRKWQSH